MKNHRSIRSMFSLLVVLLALVACVSSSRAQQLIYLKLDGINGEAKDSHKVVSCSPNKTVSSMTAGGGSKGYGVEVSGLKSGTYTVQLVNQAGVPAEGKHPAWIEVSSFQMGVTNPGVANSQSGGTGSAPSGMAVKGQGASPTSIATGQSSGKRRHNPIVVKKEVDMASPLLFTVAAADLNKDGMADLEIHFVFQKIEITK